MTKNMRIKAEDIINSQISWKDAKRKFDDLIYRWKAFKYGGTLEKLIIEDDIDKVVAKVYDRISSKLQETVGNIVESISEDIWKSYQVENIK